jgi:ketosteroid isomerase-like protein
MGSANLDLVRAIFAAFERGDYSSAEWAQPDVEWVVADGPSPGTWKGVAGMAEAARDQLDVWEDLRYHADEYHELDDDRVLVLAHLSGHGKTSRLEVGQLHTKTAALFHVRGGKVTRRVFYWDRERALADLGLVPEGGAVDDVETHGSPD